MIKGSASSPKPIKSSSVATEPPSASATSPPAKNAFLYGNSGPKVTLKPTPSKTTASPSKNSENTNTPNVIHKSTKSTSQHNNSTQSPSVQQRAQVWKERESVSNAPPSPIKTERQIPNNTRKEIAPTVKKQTSITPSPSLDSEHKDNEKVQKPNNTRVESVPVAKKQTSSPNLDNEHKVQKPNNTRVEPVAKKQTPSPKLETEHKDAEKVQKPNNTRVESEPVIKKETVQSPPPNIESEHNNTEKVQKPNTRIESVPVIKKETPVTPSPSLESEHNDTAQVKPIANSASVFWTARDHSSRLRTYTPFLNSHKSVALSTSRSNTAPSSSSPSIVPPTINSQAVPSTPPATTSQPAATPTTATSYFIPSKNFTHSQCHKNFIGHRKRIEPDTFTAPETSQESKEEKKATEESVQGDAVTTPPENADVAEAATQADEPDALEELEIDSLLDVLHKPVKEPEPTEKKPKVNICLKCNKRISGAFMEASKNRWHIECFCCVKCNTLLKSSFLFRDGEIYCEKDYADLFSPKCPKCKLPIQGAAIEIEGALYHQACFACYGCKKEISVGDEYMNIDQFTFHTDCFKCKNCKTTIGDEEFAGTDGDYFCSNCVFHKPDYSKKMNRPRASVQIDKDKAGFFGTIRHFTTMFNHPSAPKEEEPVLTELELNSKLTLDIIQLQKAIETTEQQNMELKNKIDTLKRAAKQLGQEQRALKQQLSTITAPAPVDPSTLVF